jgi:hypothetical protein
MKSLKLDIPSAATIPARTVTWTGPFCGTASSSLTVCAVPLYDTLAIFTPLRLARGSFEPRLVAVVDTAKNYVQRHPHMLRWA